MPWFGEALPLVWTWAGSFGITWEHVRNAILSPKPGPLIQKLLRERGGWAAILTKPDVLGGCLGAGPLGWEAPCGAQILHP